MRMTDSKDDELNFEKPIAFLQRSACPRPDHWMRTVAVGLQHS